MYVSSVFFSPSTTFASVFFSPSTTFASVSPSFYTKALPSEPGVIFLSGETMQHDGPVDGQFAALHPAPLMVVLTGEAWTAGCA